MSNSWQALLFLILLSTSIFLTTNKGYGDDSLNFRANFMKTNSTAHIYEKFFGYVLKNGTVNPYGIINEGYDLKNESSVARDVNITSIVSEVNSTNHTMIVTFTIIAKDNATGIYSMMLSDCGWEPIIIGMDISKVNPFAIRNFYTAAYACPASPYTAVRILGTSGMTAQYFHLTPLIQYKWSQYLSDTRCKEGFVFVAKLEDSSPACVKPSTQIILEQRGWTLPITQPNKDIMYCQKNPSNACNHTMELWYNDCGGYPNQNVTSCHDGRIEAYLKANGLSYIMTNHP
jgi:hypothetical protein